MPLIRCDFFSEALRLSTSMTVILPQETSSQIGMRGTARGGEPPTLYLLHGLSDDDTIWLRRTSIERYAAPLGLAVVMPQVHRSFYTDPALVRAFFRVSDRPEDTFVAGLSMGVTARSNGRCASLAASGPRRARVGLLGREDPGCPGLAAADPARRLTGQRFS
jgi:S-formylglutathione hydrolase FrmB